MTETSADNQTPVDPLALGRDADLETVLAAWHVATVRLEETHQVLRDEVKRLTDELEMKNRKLARKNRLAELGQISSHIAHEVRNNLVPVTLYLSLLRRRLEDDQASLDVLNKVEASFGAVNVTVNDLLSFSSDHDPRRTELAVGELLDDVLTALRPQLAAQRIEVTCRVRPNDRASVDADMLRRAVLNLVLNAVDAMPDGGTLTVAADVDARGLSLVIADTGNGLSDESTRRVFEPFYTTKHGGTGLGLAIVHRIAEAHGGQVTASNNPSRGACFTLCLPSADAREEAA